MYLSHISKGFRALFLGRIITELGVGLIGIFFPMFLFTLLGEDLRNVVWYYTGASFLYMVFIVWGVQWLNRFGMQRAIRWSRFFLMAFYLILIARSSLDLWLVLGLSIVTLTIYRALFWIPYHVDFAKFTDKKNRGKEVSTLGMAMTILGILVPLMGGYIIDQYSFNIAFLCSMALTFVSVIPYSSLPPVHEKFSWGYMETWKKFLEHKYRRSLLAFMADGAESVVGGIVWPIFIFLILKGNYFEVGALSTLIVGVTVLAQLVIGRTVDGSNRAGMRLLRAGTLLYAVGWIIKMFILTAFHIFIVGVYHSITRIVLSIPFDALTYEVAADQGHYVDEFTVLREIAVHVGKIGMGLLVVVTATFFPVQWTFILAALAAIGLNVLQPEREKESPPLPF